MVSYKPCGIVTVVSSRGAFALEVLSSGLFKPTQSEGRREKDVWSAMSLGMSDRGGSRALSRSKCKCVEREREREKLKPWYDSVRVRCLGGGGEHTSVA